MATKMRPWAKCVIALLVLVGLALAGWAVVRKSTTWTLSTTVGGQPAEVTITWTRNRSIPLGPHDSIGGGNEVHDVVVLLASGQELSFRTKREPCALWRLNGDLYVACSDLYAEKWFIARVGDDGDVTPISRKQLPKGPKPMNLLTGDDRNLPVETANYWDETP